MLFDKLSAGYDAQFAVDGDTVVFLLNLEHNICTVNPLPTHMTTTTGNNIFHFSVVSILASPSFLRQLRLLCLCGFLLKSQL